MHYKRSSTRLFLPRIQFRFGFVFVGLAATAALFQTIVVGYLLHDLASELPQDGLHFRESIPAVLLNSFLITFVALSPVMVAFGIGLRTTFRVLGPIYRFRVYFQQLADGKNPGPCKIREHDEFQDVCDLINKVTGPLRASRVSSDEEREAA